MFRSAKQLRVLLVTGVIIVTQVLLYKLSVHPVEQEILHTRLQIPSPPVYLRDGGIMQSLPRVEIRETIANMDGIESIDIGIANIIGESHGIDDGQSERRGVRTATMRDKESANVQITNSVSNNVSTRIIDTSKTHEVVDEIGVTNLQIMDTISLINSKGNESRAKFTTPAVTHDVNNAKFERIMSQNQDVVK
ncbi:hypothetical protein DPMN_068439 [Dreissena polymorpha]|uniref:Uncharacterized protein n=1 Tax=Dreissena polymorpha TaxID=45954 RepID=A0A9D4BU78_DREPO|nr:hypothetical protein DPMN_068439 [Dreissena polymorpha]